MMPRSRKNIHFPHHRLSGTSSNGGRRPSISAESDGISEPGSPNVARRQSAHEAQNGHGNGNGKGEGKESEENTAAEFEKKKQTFITRTIWTFVMIAGFFVCLFAGHLYLIGIVTAIQIVSFKEVIAIANVPNRAKNLPFTRSLNWYFLGTTMYYLYGESVIYYFKHIVLVDKVLLPFATHHRFISFMLYVMGFIFFVGSLKKGHYRFQFTQFAWTHMALYFIVVQAHFIINNIFEGLIWFFLPAALVIVNDIFAYICGVLFGRTQLIKLSPKKTVEGFVGAWISTVIWAFALTALLIRSKYFICPVNDLGANIFTGLDCTPNPVFLPQVYHLPHALVTGPLGTLLRLPATLHIAPIHLHMQLFATFASLIAPFGGFFASGLKRTFKVKDFGESIPGHGGITDRMDCQFIMGMFTFMYYHSFIAIYQTSVGAVIEMAVQGLDEEGVSEVVRGLGKYLVGQGAVDARVLECLADVVPRR